MSNKENRTIIITAIIGALATTIAALISIVPNLISVSGNVTLTPTVITSTITTPVPQITPSTPTFTPTAPVAIHPTLTPSALSTESPLIPLANENATQVIVALIAAVTTIAASTIATLFGKRLQKTPTTSYPASNRIQALIENLSKSSTEAETLLQEIITDIKTREKALNELQSKNAELATQETELKKRIEKLKDVPIEVAEYFQKINAQNLENIDKRSGQRDFQFFILGIVVSTVIAIILKALGIG
ncbi:MAG: hypothetical protein UZ14_CFX002002442 [Chloroflexi bacterium OLB14]|nr:MAG: hypothetical protein UZ14_CFX002002442 [Chloroflexi bacterium OLB14]